MKIWKCHMMFHTKSSGRVLIDVEKQENLGSYQLFPGFELVDSNCEYSFEVGAFCCILFSVLISRVKPISTGFYSLFYCCFVTPLSQVRGRVERSLTGLTPPQTLCACPKPGTCNPVVVVV